MLLWGGDVVKLTLGFRLSEISEFENDTKFHF
jgi:hypothetical protein